MDFIEKKTNLGEWSEENYARTYTMKSETWETIVPESLGGKDNVIYTQTTSRYSALFKERIWAKNGKRRKRQDENMKKIDLIEKEIIFIPICEESHWNLAVICNPKKAFDKVTLEWIKTKEEADQVRRKFNDAVFLRRVQTSVYI